MQDRFHIDLYDAAFLLLLIILVIVKIPYLTLPYYWDEAWVYGPGIRIMEAGKLSLLPDALPVYYSRGHPLLFYFLGAIWLKAFGTSLLSSHVYALCISIGLLSAVYIFCRQLFLKQAGLIACILLLIQPIFLAQSVLLLPEVMISLFSLLSVYCFIRKKWFLYILFTTFALFTKETGIVAVGTTGLWFLIDSFLLNRKEFKWKRFILNAFFLMLPLIFIATFFFIQKKMNGWYFFPEHVNYLKNDSRTFSNKLEAYSAYLFIYWGRNVLSALIIVFLAMFIIQKKHRQHKANRPLLILGTYVLLFLIASAMNFYSDRYAMSMIAPFVIISAFFITEIFRKKIIAYLITAGIIIIQLTIHIPVQTSSDHNLGYANSVWTHQQTVNYCVENNFKNKKVFTHFLMLKNLLDPYAGYIESADVFTYVTSDYSDDIEVCIFSNMEGKEDYEKIKSEGKFKLLKRFEKKQAWSEVYVRE